MPFAPPSPPPAPRGPALAFCGAVAAFAWLRFSENTADNDLWGHVLYGQRLLALGHLETTEVLSWTAAGRPWINHEVGAELVLGAIHRLAGGTGLWLFMVAMAALTVGLAVRLGDGRDARQRLAAFALLGVSVNSIALGYAVRPQLFTLLACVGLIGLLRQFFTGRPKLGFAIAALLAAWTNFHGGYLAGWLIVLVAVLAEGAALPWPDHARKLGLSALSFSAPWTLPALAAGATVALVVNPWGFNLVRWTIATVRLPRPQIAEWHAPGLSPAAPGLYLLIALSAAAWTASRLPRRPWEAAVLALLAVMSLVGLRHAPLFGLANLILTPPHLLDALRRLAPRCPGLTGFWRPHPSALLLTGALAAAGAGCLVASVSAPRAHPFTIEVPRDTYPVAAIDFMRQHRLTGRTLTFFDWGQQVLWELPDNPVSFDGRLDTVYPPDVMAAHWRFYAGETPGPGLDLAAADVALLPTAAGGVDLLRHAGWTTVYRDPLATVLVRSAPTPDAGLKPEFNGAGAIRGRVPFPAEPPVLATTRRPR